jgi:hypothetical protein
MAGKLAEDVENRTHRLLDGKQYIVQRREGCSWTTAERKSSLGREGRESMERKAGHVRATTTAVEQAEL